jgi:hypothetical protein
LPRFLSMTRYSVGLIKEAMYRLDSRTLETLNRLARRWQVSKSEAVRKALRQLMETSADFTKWKKTIKSARP